MKNNYKLRLNGKNYDLLREHLFPGDGKEAIAFALCGQYKSESEEIYTVHRVELYAHDMCLIRADDRVTWSPPDIVHLFEECRHNKDLRLLKIHSHPSHWPWFSEVDDRSDLEIGDSLTGWTGQDERLISAIMLPDGHIFGRVVEATGEFVTLESVLVVGNDIKYYLPFTENGAIVGTMTDTDPEVQLRTRQAFGEGTLNTLSRLRVGVVGCSGTGSIVAELLGRLGVGSLVLVDSDIVEQKNLNRILNSRKRDAEMKRPKVELLKEAIESMGTGVHVSVVPNILHDEEAYLAIASCEVVFGCMDSVDGRYLLNRIATFFCMAYIDIGVRLDADGKGGIADITGRVDYVQPGGSSLFSRERFSAKQLSDADLERTNPKEHQLQLEKGYVKSANVESPAVISINMMFSSMAVTELLARIHPFRDYDNSRFAYTGASLGGFLLFKDVDGEPDPGLEREVGRGMIIPILGSPLLISSKESRP